mgnify:CR=1 FL=1
MSPPDDIQGETPGGQTEPAIKPEEAVPRRRVGPESEDRGGPEAIDETLDEPGGASPKPPAGKTAHPR